MPENLILLLVILFAVIFLWEAFMIFSANRAYYRSGLTVFRQTIIPGKSIPAHLDLAALDAEFRGKLGPSLVFLKLGTGEYAFREKFFEFRLFGYTPVMRGYIRLDPISNTLLVEGNLYWTEFVVVLLWGIFVLFSGYFWAIILLVLAALGVCYLIQRSRFEKVAGYLRNSLRRPTAPAGTIF